MSLRTIMPLCFREKVYCVRVYRPIKHLREGFTSHKGRQFIFRRFCCNMKVNYKPKSSCTGLIGKYGIFKGTTNNIFF